jgi:hypothetical protein
LERRGHAVGIAGRPLSLEDRRSRTGGDTLLLPGAGTERRSHLGADGAPDRRVPDASGHGAPLSDPRAVPARRRCPLRGCGSARPATLAPASERCRRALHRGGPS